MSRVLAVRLDSDGDVLLTGPALRALAHSADHLDLLVSPAGLAAARLLPAIDDVLVFDAPWSGYRPPPVDDVAVAALIEELRARRYDRAAIFTSFHQSALPMALLARLAGIALVAATSTDYPGSLLDLRHPRADVHEVVAALDLATAAGGTLPADDDGRLALRGPLPPVGHLVPARPYVVVHPGASVPSRTLDAQHARQIVVALRAAGRTVVVTGGPGERELCGQVAGAAAGALPADRSERDGQVQRDQDGAVIDLAGRTDLAQLASVLAGARCVVVGNTGPAHLAAAVGTPVVSLFSPVVPAQRWAPYGVPLVLLGDQQAPCAGTRARECPVAGHPCLSGVPPADVVDAVARLTGHPFDARCPAAASATSAPAASTTEATSAPSPLTGARA